MTKRHGRGKHMQHEHRDGGATEATAPQTETGQTGAEQDEMTPDTLRAQLEDEKARAQDYLGKYQRAVADFQNFKRRTEEERANSARLANLSFVLNILPVVDDLERALASLDVKLAGLQWAEGIRAIQRKFENALQASGVQEKIGRASCRERV